MLENINPVFELQREILLSESLDLRSNTFDNEPTPIIDANVKLQQLFIEILNNNNMEPSTINSSKSGLEDSIMKTFAGNSDLEPTDVACADEIQSFIELKTTGPCTTIDNLEPSCDDIDSPVDDSDLDPTVTCEVGRCKSEIFATCPVCEI